MRLLKPSVLLGIAVGWLLCTAFYHAFVLFRESSSLLREASTLEDCDGNITMEIVYPGTLLSDGLNATPRPLSVWLKRESTIPASCASRTPIPSPSPTLPGTMAATVGLKPTPMPYEISFHPYDAGVLFVDQEGNPAPAHVLATPGSNSAVPGTVYLQQASLISRTDNVRIGLAAHHPDGTSLIIATPAQLNVSLEGNWISFGRHFLSFLFSPALPLLPLALAAVGYAIEQWRKGQLEIEEREKKLQSDLAEISRIISLAQYSSVDAARQLIALEERLESHGEVRSAQLDVRLKEAWTTLRGLNWQRPILKEAATFLASGEYGKARRYARIVRREDDKSIQAQVLERTIDFCRAQFDGSAEEWLKENASHDLVAALVQVLSDYDDDGLHTLVVNALADLARRAQFVRDIHMQLSGKEDARRILAEPRFVPRLRQLVEDPGTSADVKRYASDLLMRRLGRLQWLHLWPEEQSPDLPFLADWLKAEGFSTNPFGPERAEFDKQLPEYRVDDHVDMARGTQPLVVFGHPGSGRSATALMLAYTSEEPPVSSGTPPMFPLYYETSLAGDFGESSRAILESITRATSRALLRLLAVRPYTWLDLPPNRREGLGALLLICAGSKEVLLGELRRVASDPEYRRLSRTVEDLRTKPVPNHRVTESGWLDLLAGAIPYTFRYLQVIVDIKTTAPSDAIIRSFRILLELSVSLAKQGIYLKVFAPEALRGIAADLVGIPVMSLEWSEDGLSRMLENRLRRANRENLYALCELTVLADVDKQFVRAALSSQDPPRHLIRMGNHLFGKHARYRPDRQISTDEIQEALTLPAGGAPLEESRATA